MRQASERARRRPGHEARAYQKAKESLAAAGYYFDWKWQGGRGRWVTEQLLSNVTLTREEANAVRGDGSPSAGDPTVGAPESPKLGSSKPVEENREKTLPHPPPKEPTPKAEPEAEPETEPEPEREVDPEVAAAERLLLSLRHVHPGLSLGVREARRLAEAAAEWFRRGLSVADLRQALTSGLPREPIRSVVGFVRYRLAEKLPAPAPAPAPTPPPTAAPAAATAPAAAPAGLVICDGPGDDHAFRPVAGETRCGPCRTAAARQHPPQDPSDAYRTPWRTRVQEAVRSGESDPAAPSGVGLAH
ncbi:hypothetical protein ACFV9D_13515 [Streptomyces sp. NPDC059875]|uniref:hypothetical protein n=1 Tax=unclassified Streptomyces TaxID=2593676 RepID=UPI003651C36E